MTAIDPLCFATSLLLWFCFTSWSSVLRESSLFQEALGIGLTGVLLIEGVVGVGCLMIAVVSLFKDRLLRFGVGLAAGVGTVVLMAAQTFAVFASFS